MIDDLWYKNAVIYSLDLETFMDGNGDGIGDFPGLISRLDYLQALGADVIWLAPFQPSPNRDNGYDISDYFGVDPRHGSSGDFVEFMHQAKKRGMRVIIDLVVNHTSDQHPWFKQARRDKNSRYRNWYLWSKKRPPGWNKGMVFPGVQKAVWTRDPVSKEYFHHRFYDFQPDLNMDNPEVRAEIRRIMGYWLQLGVDGFRVDAVPFIIERSPLVRGPGPELRFEYLTEMRQFLQWRTADAALLGEANVLPQENRNYFGDEGDGIHMMFNFFVNQHLFYALASGDVAPLKHALTATRTIPPAAQWGQFLRNHDELDLGRLTKKQRAAVFDRFGPERSMQLYDRGIRRRLAPMLGDRQLLQLANSILFSLPGTPVIRYGDEIGMGENLALPEREAVRTPMQWSADRNAGFSLAQRLKHPVVADGDYGCARVNVESQQRNPDSFFNWTARIIRTRKECPEIAWGEWELLNTGSKAVLAMCYSWRGSQVLIVHNFSASPAKLRIRVPPLEDVVLDSAAEPPGSVLANLLDTHDSKADAHGIHHIKIEEFGYRWYRVGGLNYAINRQRATARQNARRQGRVQRKKSSLH